MKLTHKRVIMVLFLLLLGATPEVALAQEPKAPCRLQVGYAHISTHEIKFNNRRVVKVNAFSICHLPQSNVTNNVELWKIGSLGPTKVYKTKIFFPGITDAGKKLSNEQTFKVCKNSTPTKYFGVASSKAYIAGKWQFARDTFSKKPMLISCGT